MKKELHPKNYRQVVFQDINNDFRFITRSTAESEETIKWTDGNEYPLVKMYISSASHPFFTGEERVIDIEGRVDKFKARAKAALKAQENRNKAAAKKASRKKASSDEPKSTLKEVK
jgi:large subunit ribosomal protein L31